jgi:transposase
MYLLRKERELDESYVGGRGEENRGHGASGKAPVAGILERGERVLVDVVQCVEDETLLELTSMTAGGGSRRNTDCFRR